MWCCWQVFERKFWNARELPHGKRSPLTRGHFMPDEPVRPKPPEKQQVREVSSEELLRGQTELLIRHGEELYRLKLTRNQKLILHK